MYLYANRSKKYLGLLFLHKRKPEGVSWGNLSPYQKQDEVTVRAL